MHPRGNNSLLGLDISQVELNQCGVSLPLSSEAMVEINRIAVMIQQEGLLELFEQYSENMDKLAFYAYTACSYGDISTEQLATILEIRLIKKLNPIYLSIEKIDSSVLEDEQSSIAQYINDVYEAIPMRLNIQENFLNALKEKHNPDAYCIKFTFAEAEYTKQKYFDEYLKLAKWLKAARFEQSTSDNTELHTITWLSAGARDALCKTVYSDHAKKVSFYSGKNIDRAKIDEGMQQYVRYIAASLPGVTDPPDFHKLKTPAFFLTMHDEIHRQLISSIPNPVYDALLKIISLLRKTTNREWSPEIWRLVDMDFHPANLTIGYSNIKAHTPENLTDLFFRLLTGISTDYRHMDVFLPSPYCDTTWMILMDFFENRDSWMEIGIDINVIPIKYKNMYQFVSDNLHELSNTLSFPQKLLKLKCAYLHVDYPENAEIRFSQRMKNKPTYLEVLVDGKPHFYNKLALIKLLFLNDTNSFIDLQKPSIEGLMNAIFEKFRDKPNEFIETILNYATKKPAEGFLLLAIISTFDKNQISPILIENLTLKIETFSKRTTNLYFLIGYLDKHNQIFSVTPEFIEKSPSLPHNLFNFAATQPAAALLFFQGIDALEISTTELTAERVRGNETNVLLR